MSVTSIPLSSLPIATEWRRDQYGRYLIVPPGGGKPVGYTRATTVAGTLDSGGGLAPWKATMTACGLIMRRGLRAQWEALMAEHNGDPWYAGEETKKRCKELVEECATVGGANDRRDMGTSLHTITALVDLGRSVSHLTEETEADIRAYITGLDAAGVSIVPDQVELTVVLDSVCVAGTFDRLAKVPGFVKPLVADLKTGADLSYSWQSIAVQLGIYSRGEAIYRQGPAKDGSEDVRLPMPEVDQDYGLVMWLNAGTGRLELFLVDLNAGWEAFTHSMWTRQWRNANVATPLADHKPVNQGDDLTALLEASIAKVEAEKNAGAPPASLLGDATGGAPVIDVDQPGFTERLRAWLQERINTIGTIPAARTELGNRWPNGMPTLRASTSHEPEDLELIEALLDDVERQWFITPPEKPSTDTVGLLLHLFPNSTLITDKDNAS